jgi:hypothetical protein
VKKILLASTGLDHIPSQSSNNIWRGFIDSWSPNFGISGWVLAADMPMASIELQLLVGEHVVATTHTRVPRRDISDEIDIQVSPGFVFGVDAFTALANALTEDLDAPVRIRIADATTDEVEVHLVSGQVKPPTLSELLMGWQTSVLEKVLGARAERPVSSDALLSRLTSYRHQADELKARALYPVSENEKGQVELFFPAPGGQIWLAGWIHRDTSVEFPALLIERQKFPAALSFFTYERPDLPSKAVGFIGVIDTGWTPAPTTTDFFIYFGNEPVCHLRAGAFTRIIDQGTFIGLFQQMQGLALSGQINALKSVLNQGATWLPGNALASGVATQASVDRLLLLQGFGCLAEGWSISPSRRLSSLELKIADCITVSDLTSTYFKARPDLQSVFGGGKGLVEQAGFITAFMGDVHDTSTGSTLLRVVFDDGTSAVHAVESKQLHLLDPVADSDEVLRLFPAIHQEPFFKAFQGAIQQYLQRRMLAPNPVVLARASSTLVLQMPADKNSQMLLFDLLHQHLSMHPNTAHGYCFVASSSSLMGECKIWMQEIKRAFPSVALSLFQIMHADICFSSLPFILQRTGARRFAFVSQDLLLTPAGWQCAEHSLNRTSHDLDFFEIVDDSGSPDRIHSPISAGGFGWSTASLMRWTQTAPFYVRGIYLDNGLSVDPSTTVNKLPRAMMRISKPRLSRLADHIDEETRQQHLEGARASHAE